MMEKNATTTTKSVVEAKMKNKFQFETLKKEKKNK